MLFSNFKVILNIYIQPLKINVWVIVLLNKKESE